ncbi:hypothetical protein POTOM_017072 [Populus tomentosa]|uniref:Uncharacterized protein n=1 Tax=Populus tomentosa TaxID=118781 RepID=A0A8X7ZYA1_POPTO|nr:hypothetical protein POTOM_017072 [Populus tomentosa]
MSAQETCLPQKPPKLDSMKEAVIYSPKPQEISWLNNCLLASISADHPSMMHAFKNDLPYWDKYFDDIRPWLSTDCAINRSTGDIIGFDCLGLRRSALVSLRLLLGTRSDKDIRKTIILHIDGEDHTICIDEINNLHYPMVNLICYSMDTFHSNLVLEDGYTTCGSESSSDGTIAKFSVESTHNVGLDMGEKMKSFSNCEEATTDKPHLAGDIAYREASYSAPTRLQDHSSLVNINALQQLGDVSKVEDFNVQAHHLVDLGHATSGHPLTLEAQLSLGT